MSGRLSKAELLEWRRAREWLALGITRCGNTFFDWGKRTYVMGIINVSPDSFSGDGLSTVDAALAQARGFAEQGVDIIDIGGESTRPGSESISVGKELQRVIPVVERLSGEIRVPISVDTYKFEVAKRALDAGAHMLNDIWGLKMEPKLAELVAERGVPIVLMSNQRDKLKKNIVPAVIADLKRAVDLALDAGVSWENIIIDPGIGFGKTVEQNMELVRRLDTLKVLGRPILLGTSRKSMIGQMLESPAEQRLEGTAASVAIGIARGADIVRVHDVKEIVRVCRMSDAIVRDRKKLDVATAYLGLGSNLGDRGLNLAWALKLLAERVKVEQISSIYETEPMGYEPQPLFLNTVCRINTGLTPEQLLCLAKEIEIKIGRIPSFRNAPRPIDIDILLYNDKIVTSRNLTIPHPRLAERAFMLVPLAEIAPKLVYPGSGKMVGELLDNLGAVAGVCRWAVAGDVMNRR
jgi:dihydropteroate synthase